MLLEDVCSVSPLTLLSAYLLDLAIGDPAWLPHPVRGIGKGVAAMEIFLRKRFRSGQEKTAGVLLVAGIVMPACLIAALVQNLLALLPSGIPAIIGAVVLVYLVATTLALRELVQSANRVIRRVREGFLKEARAELSMIVGRDTGGLGEEGILRATVETLGENLSDGFVAPLLYLVVGGLPLAIAYKAVNTLDSMVGYKNEKYVRFGWAAAKLDDIVNYMPARITGVFIAIAIFLMRSFLSVRRAAADASAALRIMARDGRSHASPNSGVPEAAMAGALGVMLGGPSTYGGLLVEKPWIGDRVALDYRKAAHEAVTIVITASAIAVFAAIIVIRMRTGA